MLHPGEFKVAREVDWKKGINGRLVRCGQFWFSYEVSDSLQASSHTSGVVLVLSRCTTWPSDWVQVSDEGRKRLIDEMLASRLEPLLEEK